MLLGAAAGPPNIGLTTIDAAGKCEYISCAALLTAAHSEGATLQRETGAANTAVVLAAPEIEFFIAFWACVLTGITPVVAASPADFDAADPAVQRIRAVMHDLTDAPVLCPPRAASQLRLALATLAASRQGYWS